MYFAKKYSEEKDYVLYKRNGYLIQSLIDSPVRKDFVNTLNDIQQEKFKEGFSFKNNLKSFRRDLIPNVYNYSDVFLNILAENNIPDLIKNTIGPDACLINIAVVDSIPPGYMTDWHRDNFERPIHKAIFYPCFGQPKEKRLEVLEGHIKPVNRILTSKYIRYVEQKWEPVLFKYRIKPVYSSDYEFVYINTQTLHKAFEVSGDNGALRILFSFRKRFTNNQQKEKYLELADTTIKDIDILVEKYDSMAKK